MSYQQFYAEHIEKPRDVVWESSVTTEMITDAGLSKKDAKRLAEELDDAVMEICMNWGIS